MTSEVLYFSINCFAMLVSLVKCSVHVTLSKFYWFEYEFRCSSLNEIYRSICCNYRRVDEINIITHPTTFHCNLGKFTVFLIGYVNNK